MRKIQSRRDIQPKLTERNILREKDQTIYNESIKKAEFLLKRSPFPPVNLVRLLFSNLAR